MKITEKTEVKIREKRRGITFELNGKTSTFELDGKVYDVPERLEGNPYANSHLKGPNIGMAKSEIVYAEQIAEGYNLRDNSSVDQVENRKADYEAQGLEVVVGERAFWYDGKEDPNMRRMLTRPKSSESGT